MRRMRRIPKIDEFFTDVFKTLESFTKRTVRLIRKPRVVLVIPARNEEKSIAKVIRAGKKSKYVTDILVVDSFSTDKTAKVAKEAGARVVRQYSEKKGKGGAIYTGIKESDGEILVFMDADIENISPEMIDKLVKPIMKENVDHVIGNFKLERGRVTKLTALPLLNLFFPEVKFRQPLSGLFAAKSHVLKQLEIREGWGVEVSLVIDMVMKGYKTKEVYLGEVKHTANPLETKVKQAQEIAETIVQKAHEYGRIGLKMKALILATGSSPLTSMSGIPKSLIKLDDLTILEKTLSSLEELGIIDTTIVTGYKGKMIEDKFGKNWGKLKINYIENKKWKDDVLSLFLAREQMDKRFILIFSDLVSEDILARVIRERGEFVVCVDREKGKRRITIEGKTMFLVGIGVFEPKIFDFVKEAHESGRRDLSEFVRGLCQTSEVKTCDVSDCFWIDVEKEEDLKKAREYFR